MGIQNTKFTSTHCRFILIVVSTEASQFLQVDILQFTSTQFVLVVIISGAIIFVGATPWHQSSGIVVIIVLRFVFKFNIICATACYRTTTSSTVISWCD